MNKKKPEFLSRIEEQLSDISEEKPKKKKKNDTESVRKVGMFTIKPANQTLADGKAMPTPRVLWSPFFIEGEICCLFADSNLGKSILAVQIATEIARVEKVLYFDFEMSEKQFQLRYTDEDGNLFVFPANLYRVEIDQSSVDPSSSDDVIVDCIEKAALAMESKIIIIDNITYLCSRTEKGDAAGILMKRLVKLKKDMGFSIMVLAHTPKRPLYRPITANDLAGSKRLYDFFDSVVAIGKSAKNKLLKYIIEVKSRSSEYTYDEENVLVCKIEKKGNFLCFEFLNNCSEFEHLRAPSPKDVEELRKRIIILRSTGKSLREIATELQTSKSKVERVINAYMKEHEESPDKELQFPPETISDTNPTETTDGNK